METRNSSTCNRSKFIPAGTRNMQKTIRRKSRTLIQLQNLKNFTTTIRKQFKIRISNNHSTKMKCFQSTKRLSNFNNPRCNISSPIFRYQIKHSSSWFPFQFNRFKMRKPSRKLLRLRCITQRHSYMLPSYRIDLPPPLTYQRHSVSVTRFLYVRNHTLPYCIVRRATQSR